MARDMNVKDPVNARNQSYCADHEDKEGFPPLKASQVERYLQIPFKDGGRDWSGCDCWGLIYLIYQEAGYNLPAYGEIGATELIQVQRQILGDKLKPNWERVGNLEESCGDVVVMTGASRIDGVVRHALVHVGLVVRPGWVIHTEQDRGPMLVAFRGGSKRQEIVSRVKEIYRYVGKHKRKRD